jgi:hypothetical protein
MPESGLRRLADLETRAHGGRRLILREVIAHHPNASDPLRAEMASAGDLPRPSHLRNGEGSSEQSSQLSRPR